MERLARGIVGHPWWIILSVGLVTLVFAYFARNARIDSSVGTLVDPDNPAVRYYEETRRIFGSDEIDIVLIAADDVFTPAALGKLKMLSDRLAAIKGVAKVSSLATERTLMANEEGDIDNSLLMEKVPADPREISALREAVFKNPLFVDNLVSGDGKAATILLTYEPMPDAEFAASGIHDEIERVVAEARGPEQIFFTGIPTLKVRSAQLMRSDILTFGPICFVVICAVLLAAFRTARGMLLPALTTAVGVVWTVGLMGYFDVPIDIGTIVLPTLLIAVGNAYAMHIVSRYYEEAEAGGDARDRTRRAVQHLGIPVLVTALTTVLGFASLVVYRISAIRHLGIFAVFGITVLFLLAMTFTAALLAVLRVSEGPKTDQPESRWMADAMDRLGRFDMRHPVAIVVVSAVVFVVFGVGILFMQVETSYISYFPEDSPIRTATRAIGEHLGGGQMTFMVAIDGPGDNSIVRVDTLQRIAALQDFIDRLPGIDKTTSLVDFLKLLNRAFHDDDPQWFRLPASDAAVEQYLLLLDPEAIRGVVNAEYSRSAIFVRSSLDSSAAMADAIHRIERYARDSFPPEFRVQPTGTAVLLDRTADDLSSGQLQSVVTALAVVLGVLSIQFLSLRFGLVAMVPNLIPIVAFFGILGWCGISLSLATAMIASISLGIGVDEAVHLLAEFNHHVRKHADQKQAVLAAMRTVGPPVIYNTAALVLGFLVLYWSNFIPLRQFGWLSALNVLVSLVADLVLLPVALVSTRFVTLWDVLGLRLGGAPHEHIPLFHGLTASQARVAALMGVLKNVEAGEAIVRQGEAAEEMFVLVTGRAEARTTVNGRSAVLGRIERGGVIGEMGLLRRRERTADVVALEPSELLVVNERFLRVLRQRYPRIASTVLFNLTHMLSDRLEAAQRRSLAESAPAA
jgi:hydrophobe/amphiphile efflux-3 (HAE3) family protein